MGLATPDLGNRPGPARTAHSIRQRFGYNKPRGTQIERQLLIVRDDDILGGIPVFAGTRVPIRTLFDYLRTNHALDTFLDDFPTVQRRQAEEILELSARELQKPRIEAAA